METEEDVKLVEETMKDEEDKTSDGNKKEEKKKDEDDDAALLQIDTDADAGPESPAILITGAHHARELITV